MDKSNSYVFHTLGPSIGCDGIQYSNSCVAQASGLTSWTDQSGISTALDWECESNEVICTSLTGASIFEVGEWVNPNNPCDMGSCLSNGEFIGLAIDCAPLGCNDPWCLPCDGEVVYLDNQCCPVCIQSEPLCTSYSGIEIIAMEIGQILMTHVILASVVMTGSFMAS